MDNREIVYAVMIHDRHSDPECVLFADPERAIAHARKLAHEYAGRPEFVEEDLNPAMRADGWLYHANYSSEDDSVWVVGRPIERA